MATINDTDITLTVGLDPKSVNDGLKDIEKSLTDMEKRIQQLSGKASSSVDNGPRVEWIDTTAEEVTALEIKLRETCDEVNALKARLNELNSQQAGNNSMNAANISIQQLQNNLDANNQHLQAAQEQIQQLSSSLNQTTSQASQEIERLTARVAQLEQRLRGLSNQTGEVGEQTEQTGESAVQMVAAFAGGGGGGAVAAGLQQVLNRAFRTLRRMAGVVVGIVFGVRGLQAIINRIRSMIRQGFRAIYEGDKKFKKQVDDLRKSWEEVGANLAAAFMPIVQIAIPYIQQLINWINLLIEKIAMFVAAIAGQNSYTKAIKATGDAAKNAAKQLSKFDELNNLTTSGQSDWSTQQLPIDPKMLELVERLKALLDEIKKKFLELVAIPFLEGFSNAIGDWQTKIQKLKENIKSIGQSLLEIFSNPDIQKAAEDFMKELSETLGSLAGLFANVGINIAIAITGGLKQWLEENKDQIKEDIAGMFEIDTENLDKFQEIIVAISQIVDQLGESEAAASAISNVLDNMWNSFVTARMVLGELVGMLLDLFGPSITLNIDKFREALENVFVWWEKATGFWKEVGETIRNTVIGLMEAVRPWIEELGLILSDIVAFALDIWNTWVAPLLQEIADTLIQVWNEYIDPIFQDLVSIMTDLYAIMLPILKGLWNNVLKPIISWLINTLGPILVPIIKQVFNTAITLIKLALNTLKYLFDFIKHVVGFIADVVTGDMDGAVGHLKGLFQSFFDFISNALSSLVTWVTNTVTNTIAILEGLIQFVIGLGTTIGTILTGVGNDFSTLYDNIVNFLTNSKDSFRGFWTDVVNNAINAVNNLLGIIERGLGNFLTSLSQTKLAQFFADQFGWNLPSSITINRIPPIPGLATGAVIPPGMSDFIARLGDNNNETEIVSPLSTMKQALLEALQESGGAGEIHVHVDLDGREIAQAVVKQNDMYKKSTGRTMFA